MGSSVLAFPFVGGVIHQTHTACLPVWIQSYTGIAYDGPSCHICERASFFTAVNVYNVEHYS